MVWHGRGRGRRDELLARLEGRGAARAVAKVAPAPPPVPVFAPVPPWGLPPPPPSDEVASPWPPAFLGPLLLMDHWALGQDAWPETRPHVWLTGSRVRLHGARVVFETRRLTERVWVAVEFRAIEFVDPRHAGPSTLTLPPGAHITLLTLPPAPEPVVRRSVRAVEAHILRWDANPAVLEADLGPPDPPPGPGSADLVNLTVRSPAYRELREASAALVGASRLRPRAVRHSDTLHLRFGRH